MSDSLLKLVSQDIKSKNQLLFSHFELKKELLKGIIAKGFFSPTPVQEEAIPVLLRGEDALIRAKNGTGKTASYLIPLINRIDQELAEVQAVVIVPTRELAIQTKNVAAELCKYMPKLVVMDFFGGTETRQLERLEGATPQLIIGTHGKVYDLFQRRVIKLKQVNSFVIDEADMVVLDDHKHFLDIMFGKVKNFTGNPINRKPRIQLVLISATFPASVSEFSSRYMSTPRKINLMSQELTLFGISQFHVFLEEAEKVKCLLTLFTRLSIKQCFIFCNTIVRVKRLSEELNKIGYKNYCIHSEMSQDERSNIFKLFQNELDCRFIVSSDLCNRGIDLRSVNVVVNFDCPRNSNTYLHRIGRSGRYGTLSASFTFITKREIYLITQFQDDLKTIIPPAPEKIDESLYC